MKIQINKKPYGWLSADAPLSCNYITPAIIKVLKKISRQFGSILDIGSGNGFLCSQLSLLGYDVVGIEPDKHGFEISKETYPDVEFYNLGLDSEPSILIENRGDLFDVVVSTEVIEHLYSPSQLPQFAGKVLKEGGYFIISTPYHGYLKNLILALMDKWDFHHHPLLDGGHIKFWSRRTIARLLDENGFEMIGFLGVGRFPYLWKSMILIARKVS